MELDLVDDHGQFTAGAEAILNTIFARYDRDDDGLLSRDEFQEFVQCCNGKKFADSTIDRYWQYYETAKDKLTRLGFLQFTYNSTCLNPTETVKDFANHGLSPAAGVFPGSAKAWEFNLVTISTFAQYIQRWYLNECDQLTNFATEAIDKVFDMYDLNKDNCLSMVELQACQLYSYGFRFNKCELEEIKRTFDMNGTKLTRKGFREYHRSITAEDPILLYHFLAKHRSYIA